MPSIGPPKRPRSAAHLELRCLSLTGGRHAGRVDAGDPGGEVRRERGPAQRGTLPPVVSVEDPRGHCAAIGHAGPERRPGGVGHLVQQPPSPPGNLACRLSARAAVPEHVPAGPLNPDLAAGQPLVLAVVEAVADVELGLDSLEAGGGPGEPGSTAQAGADFCTSLRLKRLVSCLSGRCDAVQPEPSGRSGVPPGRGSSRGGDARRLEAGDGRGAGGDRERPSTRRISVSEHGDIQRAILPIPDRPHVGLVTYDARYPATRYPPIEPLRSPEGARTSWSSSSTRTTTLTCSTRRTTSTC